MPERLESRHAPGAMLPLLPLFSSAGESGDEPAAEFVTVERRSVRYDYRGEALARSPELHFSIQNFIEALRADEAASQPHHVQRQIVPPVTESRIPAQLAAISKAFESLLDEEPVAPEVPPPVIQPVEPGPEPEPAASGSGTVAEPTPTGSEDTQGSGAVVALPVSEAVAPVVPVEESDIVREDASKGERETASVVVVANEGQVVEVPPVMIQPVITDPESEHNQPSLEEPSSEPEFVEPVPVAEPEVVVETPTVEELTIADDASEVPSTSVEESAVETVERETAGEVPVVVTPPEVVEVEAQVTPSVSEPEVVVELAVVPPVTTSSTVSALTTPDQLSAMEVDELLDRATRVTSRNDAIIAIVDRSGQILGVHVEQGVLDTITDMDTLVFAIDGAIAKARTAAFFSSDAAILTSRTIRFISQTTITQREVEANPNSTDDMIRGPGFVAPIGVGGHFPPDVSFTPPVDLFAIEHTNRDSLVHPGANGMKQPAAVDSDGNPTAATGDDIFLGSRFGANFAAGQEIPAPESYGLVTDMLSSAQSRGIATLPGGVPLYKVDPLDGEQKLVGGIGVFFPGDDGYATFEQNFQAGVGQTTIDRLNAPLVLEAEYTAALIAANTTTIDGLPPVAGIGLLILPGQGRIDLNGITLESFGPHPFKLSSFLAFGASTFAAGADSGTRMPVTKGGALTIGGEAVPSGWLVDPTAGTNLTAAQVEDIILRGVAEAERVRAAIRLPLGTRTSMTLAVTDLDGTVLGLFRMPDSTFFSIDVAVAKARNVAYYADPAELQPEDQVPGVDAGVAFTNRTFRFLAEPRFPAGIDGTTPPAFSSLLTVGVNPTTAENLTGVTPLASDFTTVLGYDAFNPGTNFHETLPSTGYQNGVVFFPGSTPLYNGTVLVGGFGVSGDGVDQDDVVTFSGAGEFLPYKSSPITRADEVFVNDVRLPYQKFPRNPRA